MATARQTRGQALREQQTLESVLKLSETEASGATDAADTANVTDLFHAMIQSSSTLSVNSTTFVLETTSKTTIKVDSSTLPVDTHLSYANLEDSTYNESDAQPPVVYTTAPDTTTTVRKRKFSQAFKEPDDAADDEYIKPATRRNSSIENIPVLRRSTRVRNAAAFSDLGSAFLSLRVDKTALHKIVTSTSQKYVAAVSMPASKRRKIIDSLKTVVDSVNAAANTLTSVSRTQLARQRLIDQQERDVKCAERAIKLRVTFGKLPRKTIQSLKIRPIRVPTSHFTNHYRFEFGRNPFEHVSWKGPSEAQMRHAHDIIDKYHNQNFDLSKIEGGVPAHTTAGAVTVDNIFKTIFSQSTENKIAIDTHTRLCRKFKYTVDGKQIEGKIPNYHTMRTSTHEQLVTALKKGGFYEMRAKAIKQILDLVYNKNLAIAAEKGVIPVNGNATNASDFVPGLLSLDFLHDLSQNELMDYYLSIPLVGPKTASCILAFNYNLPVFAVDTHVLRFCRWFGWIPEWSTADEACMFMDKIMPNDLKNKLHQALWVHGADTSVEGHRICVKCGSRPPPKDVDIAAATCPLDALIKERKWAEKKEKPTTADGEEGDNDETIPVKKTKAKKEKSDSSPKEKRKPSMVDFGAIDPEKAMADGYLLMEYPPVDNSFGVTVWGNTAVKSRFRWELPDESDDGEDGVSVEYASGVLEGSIPSKFS